MPAYTWDNTASGYRPLAGGDLIPGGGNGYTITQMDADITAGRPVYWAHRGGSLNWSEMTMHAYDSAVAWGAKALEVSVHRASGGVWIMAHDNNTNRVTGNSHTIISTPYETLLGMAVTAPAPGGVLGRLEDLLTAYPDLVLLVDNKPNSWRPEEFFPMLKTVPDWQDHIIVKFDGEHSASMGQAAQAEGFKTAVYVYDTNIDTHLAAVAPYSDYIGLNYDAPQADWDTAAAYGKPLWGHVLPNAAAAATATSKGADILQCADVTGIIPAGGGPGPDPDPDPPTGTPTEGLAFTALPSGTGDKKWLGHFFGPFPISYDNGGETNDYWFRNFLSAYYTPSPPGAESGAHHDYGGYTRNRPVYRAPRSGSTAQWEMEDSREEVRQAVSVGMDGFFCNLMSTGTSGQNSQRYLRVVDAASERDGDFVVVPMIDTNGSIGDATPAQITDLVARFAYTTVQRGRTTGNTWRSSAWRRDDGRFVVASYKADGKPASWWTAIFDDLQTQYGIDVSFIAVSSNYNNVTDYTSVADVFATWGGGADPNIVANQSNMAGVARSANRQWMASVWPADIRAGQYNGVFDENRNTHSLRAHWERAISDDADAIQVCTWSDYREGGEVGRSVKYGMSLLDISAYYAHKWKTGNFPPILRDCLYLSHRNQSTDLPNSAYTGPQTSFMTHWQRGANRSSVRNHVEVLSMLTASATVTLTVGGTDHTYTAPAGLHVHTVPIALGNVSVKAVRGSTTVAEVTSPAAITATPYNQDRGYYVCSSLRGTDGQYDLSALLQSVNG